MVQFKTIALYNYSELDEAGKAKARDWFRDIESSSFSDYVDYDDFISICERMGVAVGMDIRYSAKQVQNDTPKIYWSGFSSQGDGASFVGTYEAVPDALGAIKAYAPTDEGLHRIAATLDAISARNPGLQARIERPHGSRYSHEMTMEVDSFTLDAEGYEQAPAEGDSEALQDAIRDLARWLYRALESDYEGRLGDDALAEGIEANEYTFTKEGKREN